MRLYYRSLISASFLVFIFLLSACSQQSYEPVQSLEQQDCVDSGGVWHQFPNACADKCGTQDDDLCAEVLTMSCDCGENRCWNGSSCVLEA